MQADPLTTARIAACESLEDRVKVLGYRLYDLIVPYYQPCNRTGKIVGILLEISTEELLAFLMPHDPLQGARTLISWVLRADGELCEVYACAIQSYFRMRKERQYYRKVRFYVVYIQGVIKKQVWPASCKMKDAVRQAAATQCKIAIGTKQVAEHATATVW